MRYGVEPGAVGADAGGVSSALEILAGVRVGDALGPLGVGLPGTRTARCLSQARFDWDHQIRAVRRELGSLGEAMTAAALTYEQVEAIVARSLGSGPHVPPTGLVSVSRLRVTSFRAPASGQGPE